MAETLEVPAEVDILAELRRDRQRLTNATAELFKVTLELRGGVNRDGELVRGVADQLQEQIDLELIALEERYLDQETRLPAADIRAARVNKIVREKHEDLWLRFVSLEAREVSLKRTISSRKQTIGAAQSILNGERG